MASPDATVSLGYGRTPRASGAPPFRPSRRQALALLGGLAAGLLGASCGSLVPRAPTPAVSSGAGLTPAPKPPVATSSPSPGAAALRSVPRDRTLILMGTGGEARVVFTDVEQQNPFLPSTSRSGFQVVMEPLFYYNSYHTAQVCGPPGVRQCNDGEIPWLATYYAYNADYTELMIYLREGVTWSDGQPFTADDVAFTITMLKDNAPDLLWSIDMRSWVREAVALDPFTVHVQLTGPNPRFMFEYFMFHQDFGIPIVPAHIFRGKNPRTFANFDLARGWPVVTGPYRLVYSDAHRKVWDRRDDWWAARTGFQPLPAPERLIFLPSDGAATLVETIVRNDADSTLNVDVDSMQVALSRNPKITTWTNHQPPYGYVDYWTTGLGFNDSKPPFNDPQIRWAINAAINRDELVAVGYRGAGETAVLPYPDFPALRPFLDGVADLLTTYPVGTYDPDRSARILQALGYTRDTAGFWVRNGQRFVIPIVAPEFEQDVASALVAQLRRAGFEASLSTPTDYVARIYTGRAAAYLFGHSGSIRDPYDTMKLYHSRYTAPTGQWAAQPYRWANRRFDQIVDQMATVASTDPQLERLFRAALAIWLPELPDIPLAQYYHRIPVNTTYWTNWPDATNPYINTANWHRTFELVVVSLRPA